MQTQRENHHSDNDGRPRVNLGRVLSPAEFARECESTVQRPSYSGWALGAYLSDQVVETLENPAVPRGAGLALLSSSNGPIYPVALFQAGGLQLRVMLSLADPRAQSWLTEAVKLGRMNLAADVPETGQLMVFTGRCDKRPKWEVAEKVRRCRTLEDPMRLFDEYLLATRLTQAATVESMLPGVEVQSVRLVLALPDASRLLQPHDASTEGVALH